MRRLLACLALAAASATAHAQTAPAPATGDRLERIRVAGALRVCIWPDYYGITFRNPKSGELSGLDEILSREFAKDLGVRVELTASSRLRAIPGTSSF